MSGSEDQSFRKWDIATGEQLQLRETGDTAEGMALSPDGRDIIHHVTHAIYWWDPGQFDGPHQKLIGHEVQIYDLAFSNDGQLALSASEDGTVRVWSLGRSDIQQTKLGSPALGVAASPDGTMLAINSWGPSVELWDVATNEPLQTLSDVNSFLGPEQSQSALVANIIKSRMRAVWLCGNWRLERWSVIFRSRSQTREPSLLARIARLYCPAAWDRKEKGT